MNMKYASALLFALACLLIGITFAQTWNIISNVHEDQTLVVPSLPVTVGPHPAAVAALKNAVVGRPFLFPIDVFNPNNDTASGRLMVNFTKLGIVPSDVHIYCDASGRCCVPYFQGVYGQTLVYIIQPPDTTYISYSSGLNTNVTILVMQYNTLGTYTWSLAIIL